MGELIGVATSEKDGILDKNLRSNLNFTVSNNGGSPNKIFELKGFDTGANVLDVVGRDNTNTLSYIRLVFNRSSFSILSQSGSTLKLYYKTEGESNRYFISPRGSFGFAVCSLLTYGTRKISCDEINIQTTELKEII